MNKNFLYLFLFVSILPTHLFSQVCGSQNMFSQGYTLEMTSYVHDKSVGTTHIRVESVEKSQGRSSSTLKIGSKDEKGKLHFEDAVSNYQCDGKTMFFDLVSIMNSMVQTTDVRITSTGDVVEYPISMAIGDELKPTNYTLNMESNDFSMKIEAVFQNRKVVARESVTTAAGSYDCYKIEYESSQNIRGVNVVQKAEEWFSPSLGFLVKSKTYDPQGKLLSYSELTKSYQE